MLNELDVLRDVSQKLEAAEIAYMLTGSLAMAYYAMPRMTRDIDLVIELQPDDVARVEELFRSAYYVSPEAIEEAVALRTSFNLIHRDAVLKVDCFPRKPGEFREVEFRPRGRVRMGDFETWIVTREDLILSKLLWARDSDSELQLGDVRNLADGPFDAPYLSRWIEKLGVMDLWQKVSR